MERHNGRSVAWRLYLPAIPHGGRGAETALCRASRSSGRITRTPTTSAAPTFMPRTGGSQSSPRCVPEGADPLHPGKPVWPLLGGGAARCDPACRVAALNSIPPAGSMAGITIINRESDESLAARGRERFELPMFIAMDRPKHTGQRRTVAPAFTPAEMKRMEPDIRAAHRRGAGPLALWRGVRLGGECFNRADYGDAGDPVRLSRGRTGGCSPSGPIGRAIQSWPSCRRWRICAKGC